MYRKREESKNEPLISILASSVTEMIPAILGSTLATIAVYIPIAFIGIEFLVHSRITKRTIMCGISSFLGLLFKCFTNF